MAIVPKKAKADEAGNGGRVRDISTAKGKAGRGRPSGRGYDPATGAEVLGSTYKEEATRESTSEFDVFTLVNERGYRANRFYTRSLNADGHGERINVRVPQGIDSQIHAAVAEIAEYRSVHDFVRDACVHRLEFLQHHYELGEGARRTLELERLHADRERRAQERIVMKESVEDLAVKLQALWDEEDWGLLAEEIEQAEESVDWYRDPYKARARVVLDGWKKRARVQIKEIRGNRERMD